MSGLIAFVGDGLTADGRWGDWFPEYEVQNLGVSGETTDDVLARFDAIVDLAPDAVIIEIGTNDLGWRRSAEYIVRNIENLMYELRRHLPETRILVQSVLPREGDYAETIADVNRHLWQFAPTQRAAYLDLWPVLADDNNELDPAFSEDHLHLSDAGYEAWVNALKPAIQNLFEHPPVTSAIPIQQV